MEIKSVLFNHGPATFHSGDQDFLLLLFNHGPATLKNVHCSFFVICSHAKENHNRRLHLAM